MKNLIRYALLLTTLFATCIWLVDVRGEGRPRTKGDYFVYIGTYTPPRSKSQGIYVYKFVGATSKLTPLGLAAESKDPTFLALDPTHRYLYATNEIDSYEGQRNGSVSAFSIDRKTGKLTSLNVVASDDPRPVFLTIDHTGKYVLIANYDVASVAVFPILADGSLGKATACLPQTGHSVNPKRQKSAHAHSIYVSPDNRFAVSPDLGTDKVYMYRFDAKTGTLTPNQPPSVAVPAGSGPRHFAFDPNGKFAYAIEEMGSSLTAFSWDAARGILHPLETVSTLPKDFKGSSTCAELYFLPNGKYLYASNRGADSITVFSINPHTGLPTPVQYVSTEGKTPRGFGIDPTGSYLIAANQHTNTLVVFRVDAKTGRLTPTGQKEEVQGPACVVFEPAE